jgi:uncharacterized protein DUF4115
MVSRRRLGLAWTAFYLVVVGTLVALIVPAWQRYSEPPARAEAAFRPPVRPDPLRVAVPSAVTRRVVTATPAPPPAKPKPRTVRLVLVAARGACWVRVRADSATGRILFEGIVAVGARRAFTGRKLVVHAGAPENLDVTVDGAPRRLGTQPLWVATRAGLEPLRL